MLCDTKSVLFSGSCMLLYIMFIGLDTLNMMSQLTDYISDKGRKLNRCDFSRNCSFKVCLLEGLDVAVQQAQKRKINK